MLVKELIAQLQEYKPDDELIVAYWDKQTVEDYDEDLSLTDTQWSEVVSRYENGEWHWQSSAGEDFVEIANEVLIDAEVEA